MKDSPLTFSSSNGCESTALVEWEFAYTAKRELGQYPERKELTDKPEMWRRPVPIAAFMEEGGRVETEANSRLREGGHSLLILEEVLAGRLYTGPMCVAPPVETSSSGDLHVVGPCPGGHHSQR